jgi:DNA-binding GntR family transcriptional regulator
MSSNAKQRLQPPGPDVVGSIVSSLQERIHDGSLPAGTWIRQDALSDEYNVSRTPVRQALEQLRALGLLEIVPRRGARVRQPTERQIVEAYAVRAVLEGYAAEQAVHLISARQLDRLLEAESLFQRAVEAVRAGTSSDDWYRANDQFHDVILEAAANDRLIWTIRALHMSFPRNLTWSAMHDDARLLEQNAKQHAAIREAIEQRDGSRARELMIEHVESAGRLVALRASRNASADT